MQSSVHLGSSSVFLLLLLLLGCGARNELSERRYDAAPVDSGRLDSAVPIADAAPLDAGAPLACDGLPLPRAGAVSTFAAPPRVDPTGTLVPDSLGILVPGGGPLFGVPGREVVYLDLESASADQLPVLGDAIDVPNGAALAVYLGEATRSVVVVGGRTGGAPTAQTFSLSDESDPSAPSGVAARSLPPHPAGPVEGHVGIYDPVAARVVVHGGGDDVGTWSLEISDTTGEATWRELLPAGSSPPAAARAMGYDPNAHRAIEISDDEDGEGVAVYALDLEEGAERWQRLGPIDFVPSVRGELFWDDRICGFHLLSARRTRCVLEHWILTMTSPPSTIFRGELPLDPATFGAAAHFVASTGELIVYGGEECEAPGVPHTVAQRIALTR